MTPAVGERCSWLVAALLMCGCASIPSPPRVPVQPTVIQVLHRSARDSAGRLAGPTTGDLVDSAITALAGAELPFDAWDWVVPSRRTPLVLAVPKTSQVAETVMGRLERVSKKPPRLVEWKPGDPKIPTASGERWVVLVYQPDFNRPGGLGEVLRDALEPVPETLPVFLVDLLDVTLPEGVWQADEILASENPMAAECATRFIMATRRQARPPSPEDLGPDCADLVQELEWERIGVTR